MAVIRPELFTYQDALEHLEAHTLGGAMDAERRDFRSDVLGAYVDLASRYDWLYYHTEHEIRLEAQYSTGTITYDNSTKQVTIYDVDDLAETAATWPTNATEGRIKINDVRYPIESRVSNTVIKLPDDINPGENISTTTPYVTNATKVAAEASRGTTTYTWLRSSYTLPADFKDMDPPHTENSYFNQRPVSLDSIMAFERHIRASSNPPRWYAIGPDPNLYGQMAMYVQYEPNEAEGLRFFYRRFPRPITYSGTEPASYTETLALSNAGQAVVNGATGTEFNSNMVGSVLRIGTTSTKPTGKRGLNPFVEQRIIKSVGSATQLTLDANLENTISAGTKYVISDPLDLRPTMIEPFLRGCEWKLSLSRRNAESPPQELHQWYMEAIRIAGEAEATVEQAWVPPAMYNRGIQAIVTPSVSG